jgi:hypothetical protein
MDRRPIRESWNGARSLSSCFRHSWYSGNRESRGPRPDRTGCGTGANWPSIHRIVAALGGHLIAENDQARRDLGGRLQ